MCYNSTQSQDTGVRTKEKVRETKKYDDMLRRCRSNNVKHKLAKRNTFKSSIVQHSDSSSQQQGILF